MSVFAALSDGVGHPEQNGPVPKQSRGVGGSSGAPSGKPAPLRSPADLAAHRMWALGLWGARAATAGDVVRQLVAVQSQEHTTARWSVAQRMGRPVGAADIDEAFDRGELVRTHVLRPTWHYVSPEDVRWLVRFSGPRIAARYARYWAQFGLDARTLAASTDQIARAVEDGPCTRAELGARLRRRRDPVPPPELAAMVMHAELHMAVCSGPMRGRQHTYAAFDRRAGGDGPAGDEALELLARRYFTTRGPATAADFAWWAGLPVVDARRGLDLAAPHLELHDEEGRRYAFFPRAERRVGPAIDFVQCYDEAVVSYAESRDVLKTSQVSFDPLRRMDGYIHLILRGGQLLGHWRVDRRADAIEVRLAAASSPSEQESVRDRAEGLRRFLLA